MAFRYLEVDETDFSNGLLLVMAPSYGMVGPVASRFLIDGLKLELGGVFTANELPASALAWHGIVSGPIQVWHAAGKFGPDGRHDGLAVLNVDPPLPADSLAAFADAVFDFVATHKMQLVLTLEGVPATEGQKNPPIMYAANLPAEGVARSVTGEPIHGAVTGVGAAVLVEGNMRKVPVIALYASAADEGGDPGAAARVLAALRPLVPHGGIDPNFLAKETSDIERKLREEREKQARDAARIQGEIARSYL